MQILRWMLLVTLAGAVQGCGQKGPLVLPDAQRPHRQIGIPHTPAPKPTAAPTPTAPITPAAPAPAAVGPGAVTSPPDAAPQP